MGNIFLKRIRFAACLLDTKYEHQTTIIEEQNFTIFCLMKRANRIELLSQLSKKTLLCMDDKKAPNVYVMLAWIQVIHYFVLRKFPINAVFGRNRSHNNLKFMFSEKAITIWTYICLRFDVTKVPIFCV